MSKSLQNKLYIFLCLILALHPFIELDYLLANFFDSLSLPRITTVIDYLVLPLMVLICFFFFEKRKKRVIIVSLIYGVLFLAYFIYHCKQANRLQYDLYLTNNFIFRVKDELFYTVTLLLPLVYIYVFHLIEVNEESLKTISEMISVLVALPIFISNLFVFSKSTYAGKTIDNFLSWFSLPFNAEDNHPRYYASKFFFEEGNTIGVLLLMVLPFLYYFLLKTKNKKEKAFLTVLIAIHSLAMVMLSTRVATYGALLVPLAIIIIYFLQIALKQEKFKAIYLSFLVIMCALTGFILPYSPAYQNQLLDAQDYEVLLGDDSIRTSSTAEEIRRAGRDLVKFSAEWINYYVYMFQEYRFLMNVTPPIYYLEYYDYRFDPGFWVDFIFDYDLEERVSGRQLENIFTHYKYDPLTTKEKIFGMGYGTFMRGGILIEQDFVQQYYSYGLIGFIFLMLPWLIIFAYQAIKVLVGLRKRRWNFLNICLLMSIAMGLLASYLSGHVIDELSTSLYLSFMIALLFRRIIWQS